MTSSRTSAARAWHIGALAVLLGLTAAMPAAAQWKWRDKSGQTQYSDLPPPRETPEHDILQRPSVGRLAPAPAASAASAAPLAASRASDPVLEARRKQVEQEAADKRKAEDARLAAVKAENCSRAQAQLRTLDSGQRMSRIDEKGERVILDDAARTQEAQRARSVIASECK